MAYIKKNTNLLLLMLIIITLGAFAGFSTYYQTTYKNLSMSYNEKLTMLNQMNKNLTQQKTQLSQLNEELKLKSAVKAKFDQLYANITDYNEAISSDLTSTRKELIQTLSELKNVKSDLEDTKSELETTKSALKTQQQYSLDLQGTISGLRSEVCAVRKRLNETC
ncbi:hypothetical protein HYU11_00685 [Candidatus Woesearchaeota archaeon]|nr:hypothetical protein [Candidatus Woesearchaeota archaeon]